MTSYYGYRDAFSDPLCFARSTAAKASDSGSQAAVKGYMSFVLILVAGLSCTSQSFWSEKHFLIAFISPVTRFCGSTAYMLIRLFAGE